MWIEINADSLLPVPDIGSGTESYRKFIGISKISAYGESIYYSEPLIEYAPESNATKAYKNLAKELINYEG